MTASSLARLPSRRGFTSLLLALLAAGCIGDTSVSEQDALGEQLESMPYLTWVSAGDLEKSGVVQIDRDRASPGLNLYSPRNRPQAILMNLDGEIVHSWRAVVERGDTWQHVELLPNGDLLVVVAERRLLKVDANSKVVWTLDGQFHHDLAVSEVGRIYSILRGERSVDIDGEEVSILDDSIAVISPDGELLETVSIYDLFSDQVPASRWEHVKRWLSRSDTIEAANKRREKGELPFLHGSPVDLFHVNTVEIIPRDVDGVARKGDLLISLRELDQIAVLDLQTRAIRWRWGPGILRSQHQPTLLDNDNILVFDNKGAGTKISRVIELDPQSSEIVWEYLADPPEGFYSARRSGNERLPNGNTLITESDTGRAFEVTVDGEIVWDFYVPIINRQKKSRVSVYRMTRLSLSAEELAWLDGPSPTPSP